MHFKAYSLSEVSSVSNVQILSFDLVQSNRPYVFYVHVSIFREVQVLEAFLKVLLVEWDIRELLRQYGFTPWTQIFLGELAPLFRVHTTVNFIGDTFNCVTVKLKVIFYAHRRLM